ncbi:hypothetical protein ACOJBM_33420 [Rhizobium beringeri]
MTVGNGKTLASQSPLKTAVPVFGRLSRRKGFGKAGEAPRIARAGKPPASVPAVINE